MTEHQHLTPETLDAYEREPKIRRELKRFRSATLAELLLKASDERRAVDPGEAHHLALLADAVLQQTPHAAHTEDMRVLCLAHKAAASKALGDLGAAERQFRSARALCERLLAPDLRMQADLDRIEGGYRKDRRQLRRSEEHLSSKTHLRLFLMGRYNTTLYLTEAGLGEEAARGFKADLPLYEKARSSWPNLDLHFHWLAGKIQRGLSKLPQAEDHLTRARDGFAEHGTSYDAILVCLDLALVYAAQKRHEELSELGDLMVSGFAAQGLHDEALAAVSLAAEAARERHLTEELARKVSHSLQFSRHDPSLKWRFDRDLGH